MFYTRQDFSCFESFHQTFNPFHVHTFNPLHVNNHFQYNTLHLHNMQLSTSTGFCLKNKSDVHVCAVHVFVFYLDALNSWPANVSEQNNYTLQ